MRLRWWMLGLSVAFAVVPASAAGAGGGEHAAGGGGGGHCEGFASGGTVVMRDSCFAGVAHFAAVGKLTVANEGEQTHNLTSVDGRFDAVSLGAGGSARLTMAEAGIYRVYCTLHGSPDGGGMAGVLIVGDAAPEAALASAEFVAAAGGGGDAAEVGGLDALDALLIAVLAAVGAGAGGAIAWRGVRRRQGVGAGSGA